jgi:hypothetical protein
MLEDGRAAVELRARQPRLTGTEAEKQLRHRWRPGYPDPCGG